jgi:hypothetical protein
VEEEADGGADGPDGGLHLLLHHAAHDGLHVGAGARVVAHLQVRRAGLREADGGGDGREDEQRRRRRRPGHLGCLLLCSCSGYVQVMQNWWVYIMRCSKDAKW